MYADPTLMDLAAAYANRRNGRKTKHAVACDRPGARAKMANDENSSIARHRFILQQLKALLANAKADRNTEAERLASRYLQRILKPSASSQDWMESEDALSRIEDVLHGEYARVGAKTKFAQPTFSASDLNALKRLVKQYEQQAKTSKGKQGPNGENLEFKALSIAGWMQEMINYAQAGQTHRAYSIVRTSNPDYVRFLPPSLVKAAWDVTKMSRPGAKAKMGRDEQIAKAERLLQEAKSLMDSNLWGKASARIMDLQDVLRGRANRGDKNITTDEKAQRLLTDAKAMLKQMETIRKSTHSALPPQTLEAERKPGGGSHSEAVSRKIATPINEGKPQDQAVAIALDLERRGEL